MVSSGTVTGNLSTLTTHIKSYQTEISGVGSNWKGASYDNLSSKANSFADECISTITSEMEAFASACDKYEEYIQTKKDYETALSNYNTALSNKNIDAAASYSSQAASLRTKKETLKSEIDALLQTASSGSIS